MIELRSHQHVAAEILVAGRLEAGTCSRDRGEGGVTCEEKMVLMWVFCNHFWISTVSVPHSSHDGKDMSCKIVDHKNVFPFKTRCSLEIQTFAEG